MSKITDSARGESCALRLPGVCNRDPETTVWAHWNDLPGGKAKGKKLARFDHMGAYACYACHMVLDGQAKRPDGLALDFVKTAMARAVEESADKLKEKGLWPTDAELASKPVTVQKIVKKVRTLADREASAHEKSREPVRAGRGFPSRKTANNVGSTRIVAGPSAKEKPARSPWPKGRKLTSANRLQSRSFGSR
ncbi:DUF1364 family protein [Paraburkholderia sediminicola]|uniref:nuclease domain-containing protein n=1 Tax=Paraburkholderia sediminicola TaxID=458836 RepID=UPI0038BD404D